MAEENNTLLENGVENIADAPPYPEDMPAPPTDTRTEEGYLIISAGSGGKAYPLGNVQAEVYLQGDDGEWKLYRRTSTDATGAAPKLTIPTPQSTESGDEQSPYAPYTLARIRAFRDGYYPIEAKQVPVFSGITSLQYFEFIPLSERDTFAPPSGSLTAVGENAGASIDKFTHNGDTPLQNNAE